MAEAADDTAHSARVAFGRRVRAVRTERGWSQEELADRAGLHRTYISSLERGQRNVSLENIRHLADALDVSPGDLLDAD